ncbi:MAG: hypothetical protein ACRDNO_29240 [Trebonia sp.]
MSPPTATQLLTSGQETSVSCVYWPLTPFASEGSGARSAFQEPALQESGAGTAAGECPAPLAEAACSALLGAGGEAHPEQAATPMPMTRATAVATAPWFGRRPRRLAPLRAA